MYLTYFVLYTHQVYYLDFGPTNEAISSYAHGYCEQAVIRPHYIGAECNDTENTVV